MKLDNLELFAGLVPRGARVQVGRGLAGRGMPGYRGGPHQAGMWVVWRGPEQAIVQARLRGGAPPEGPCWETTLPLLRRYGLQAPQLAAVPDLEPAGVQPRARTVDRPRHLGDDEVRAVEQVVRACPLRGRFGWVELRQGRAVATDGHRLAWAGGPQTMKGEAPAWWAEKHAREGAVLLPGWLVARGVPDLLRAGGPGLVDGAGLVGFATPDGGVAGQWSGPSGWPNEHDRAKVLKRKRNQDLVRVVVRGGELAAAAAGMRDRGARYCRLAWQDELLHLSGTDQQGATLDEQDLSALLVDGPWPRAAEVAVNARYCVDACAVAGFGPLTLELAGPSGPVVFAPQQGGARGCVVMPCLLDKLQRAVHTVAELVRDAADPPVKITWLDRATREANQ